MMLPSTSDRVPSNTAAEANESIRHATEESVWRFARRGHGAITERLQELDQEWDIERTLEANAPRYVFWA